MSEYQERRAQYLRDAHDWAEDDQPDGSADYATIQFKPPHENRYYTSAPVALEAAKKIAAQALVANASEIEQAYLRGYEQGLVDARAERELL